MASPSLRQLRTFIAAMESGSVSAAARSLKLTQPAASLQLRELERLLGARLFDRARGRLIPTPAGAALLAPARRAQAAVEDAVEAVAGHRAGEAGRLRVGTGATACIYLLPTPLAAVRRRMPGLAITVATGNTREILERVEAGDLDIAIVTLPIPESRTLARTRILVDPQLALLPKAMAPAGRGIEAAAIARLPLILYEAGGVTRAITDAWFRRAGLTLEPIMELGSVEAIKVLVGSGLGAAILPRLALQEAVPGTLVRPLRPPLARDLALVLRKEKVRDRGLRLFTEELGKAVRDSPA
ncbi:MAG TPA: LysR family transcriptional regulator [Stellaceae bacterium]|nr:LysR family transcriptional regulator [Stellaceae bacterium]